MKLYIIEYDCVKCCFIFLKSIVWFVFFCSLLIYLLKRTSLQIANILVSLPKFYLCQGFCMPNLGPRIWVKAFWRSSVVLIPSLGVSAVTLAVAFLNLLRVSKGFWEEMITNHSMWWSKENSIEIFGFTFIVSSSRFLFQTFLSCLFIWPAIWWQIWPNTCHACSFPCQLGNFEAFLSSETRTPSPWPVVPCWLSVELTYELVIWMPLGVEMDGPSHWKWVDSIWISRPGWKFEIDGVVRCTAK